MKRTTIAGAACVTVLVVLAASHRGVEQDVDARGAVSPAATSATPSTEEAHQGFLYGRVTTADGSIHVGRLRFGRDEEAFWGNYFNGFKDENPWAAQLQVAALTHKRRAFTIFGFEIPFGERQMDLGRPFMARFGDIARIEMDGLSAMYTEGCVYAIDGVSAEFHNWHFNVRASNTEPLLRLNLEATTQEMMEQKRDEILAFIRS